MNAWPDLKVSNSTPLKPTEPILQGANYALCFLQENLEQKRQPPFPYQEAQGGVRNLSTYSAHLFR